MEIRSVMRFLGKLDRGGRQVDARHLEPTTRQPSRDRAVSTPDVEQPRTRYEPLLGGPLNLRRDPLGKPSRGVVRLGPIALPAQRANAQAALFDHRAPVPAPAHQRAWTNEMIQPGGRAGTRPQQRPRRLLTHPAPDIRAPAEKLSSAQPTANYPDPA